MRVTKGARSAAIAVSAALVAGAVAVGAVRADPTPVLPTIAPDALLASTIQAVASAPTVAGTVHTHIDLGVPELPSLSAGGGGGGAASPASMILGDQTFRVWRSPDGVRLAHIGQFQEQVLVANETQAWAWDSQSLSAVRLTARGAASVVPDLLARRLNREAPTPSSLPSWLGDPLSIARTVLEAVRPYATVSMATPERVAGRDAYILQLRPESGRTLVGSVDVAIDAATRTPLRVQVVPRNALDPAIEVGFTSIDYGPIEPSVFSFRPPPGATVTPAAPSLRHAARVTRRHAAPASEAPARLQRSLPETRMFGSGFGIVLAMRVQPVPAELRSLLPYGGPLASAALVDRGTHAWVVAGPVRPEALAQVQPKLP
jgi:outer membrane lipoprotein-sorting protein